MMNRFTVVRYVESPEDLAVPVIDGTPLFEICGDRYPGLPVSAVAPPAGQWLGSPSWVEEGRAVILDGTCGIAGCCGVMAKIEMKTGRVVWKDFFARGRPELPGPMLFEFDREEYEVALRSLATQERLEWNDNEGA